MVEPVCIKCGHDAEEHHLVVGDPPESGPRRACWKLGCNCWEYQGWPQTEGLAPGVMEAAVAVERFYVDHIKHHMQQVALSIPSTERVAAVIQKALVANPVQTPASGLLALMAVLPGAEELETMAGTLETCGWPAKYVAVLRAAGAFRKVHGI